ncbi:undecaprenyldiphospho-muramoylpentapeptide beta-N-acetylglucosaminyltransferase [Evansella cellulosilytica]|uniref:UDP-N-acetylglucosamine--N-acetylmuramyl-(pentapeptide) pyrophosphoryl-undecaprenol N-acetylglucosamine transferase n=1 Tax=Evansella cellulosilytica (strain ATCC 21833 / DSM 2522 / FERM P-1141 / JCM 9156 / N-4) TaxID=649639 RepID=E6U1C1_EVAC2|nr:undecaprenyldiphospho-muramoylpentapeptide beta-N-acetylglucosaminyltransferase [Evansella cellulosilytica]ADU29168.1 UDP-N-acetylglucosamine--N-acetylmuramyl-(pentapeptide) pyrophosphoryl-undecaprenol N-acetylglucosamine transferase [Evansella cellulosilytica DSM 2522]
MSQKTVVFTGGGTAGHVTPNIAIINELDDSWNVEYIGSYDGIEKELIENIHIPYHCISSGKLRRYFSKKNFTDIFRVLKGIRDARRVLKKLKPAVIFSKGGFVTVPVVIAASMLKIPVLLHESDITPGLANKIAQRFSTNIFTSFEEAANYFPSEKTKVVGTPIRKELFSGDAVKGRSFLNFTTDKPILTIMGGSLGSKKINESVRGTLPQLLEKYQIVHLCGKGNKETDLENKKGYKQFEYLNEELSDVLAATDYVISRGGSNSIFEFLHLNIPMLIIPLTRNQSRGDQILNAKSFQKKGYAIMLEEEHLNNNSLLTNLEDLQQKGPKMKAKMSEALATSTVDVIIQELEAKSKR